MLFLLSEGERDFFKSPYAKIQQRILSCGAVLLRCFFVSLRLRFYTVTLRYVATVRFAMQRRYIAAFFVTLCCYCVFLYCIMLCFPLWHRVESCGTVLHSVALCRQRSDACVNLYNAQVHN